MIGSSNSESSVRKLAHMYGYRISKSRQREHFNNRGLFQLID
jgi:hypothetical protein